MTRELIFSGIVQGIGFRPIAQRIAIELGVRGQVNNSGGNAKLIIIGEKAALDEFVQRLISHFEIKNYSDKIIDDINLDSFKIVESENDKETPFITPDLATCEDCERELLNNKNRRFNHPFISCINCGPRYSIIKNLPYDRRNITMDKFEMCSECKNEYTTPQDRRCHAQTIACKNCGPKTNITIEKAVSILKKNKILAIKDIGGYHLACNVNSEITVNELRKIKGREAKPFAVMFKSIDEIKKYCFVNNKEKEILLSPARPIVLLKKKKDFNKEVCSDSDYIGAFLPCNPIQILILNEISPLVMTSANISGEPIIIDDENIKKFNVDILSHDREILTPLDDSILKVVDDKIQFIRRARGYVPLSIDIGIKSKRDTLLMGGDLKATFAFQRDKYVFLSQYFGDLENSKIYEVYKRNIDRFAFLHSFEKDKIVCDKHPNYYSSNFYKNDLTVQHHEAHAASVIAEHHLNGNCLCFCFDGTGYGDDGAIWGSEIFTFDGKIFKRIDHLKYTKMLASDEISKNADYCLNCYLGGNELIDKAIENDVNVINSSSMGRLFDAVCALLDIKHYNTFEGECAQALESYANKSNEEYKLNLSFNPVEILTQIKNSNAKKEDLALGFHLMLSRYILKTAKEQNIKQIVLSGGVFNNSILLKNTLDLLKQNGFEVYINEKVPCGDGGIALGQAYISSLEEE